MKKKNTLTLKKKTKKALKIWKIPNRGDFSIQKINTNSKQSITLAKETSEQKLSPPLSKLWDQNCYSSVWSHDQSSEQLSSHQTHSYLSLSLLEFLFSDQKVQKLDADHLEQATLKQKFQLYQALFLLLLRSSRHKIIS